VEEFMLERFASRYLWFSPFVFIVLLPLYHGVGFWAGVTGGVLHLALVAGGSMQTAPSPLKMMQSVSCSGLFC
jgi:hypothetical protein